MDEIVKAKEAAMRPSKESVDRSRLNEKGENIVDGATDEAPQEAEQDWDSMEGARPAATLAQGDGDEGEGIESAVTSGIESDGSLPEEDDDNPDQESDEALPDDEEQRAIRNDMGGRGIRYKPE
jgi:hypothetical protein